MAILKIRDAQGNVIDIPAIKGDNGIGITNTKINNNGELIITYSNNTTSNLGVIVGANGDRYELTDEDKAQIAQEVGNIITVPTKTSELTNDSGFLTNYAETDPTVPDWAKEPIKPSYTADEVGALADTTVLADLTDDANHRTVTDTEKDSWNAKSDFSGKYSDLENAPDITEDGTGDLIIADASGNIIFRSNGNGFETANLIVQNLTINGMTIQEMIKAYMEEAMLGGNTTEA